jgi:hypothetical protein
MYQDRNSIEGEKLLGLEPGHSCTQASRWKDHKYLHNGWSIALSQAEFA